MSEKFQHIRMHMSRIRAEFDKGTPPEVAVKTMRLILERQNMADRLSLDASQARDGSDSQAEDQDRP